MLHIVTYRMLFVTQTKNKFVMLKVLKELSGKGAVLDLHSDSVQRKLNRLHVRHQWYSTGHTHVRLYSCSTISLSAAGISTPM